MGVGGRQYWGENYKFEREYRIVRRFSSLLCCEGRAAGAGVVLWRSVEGGSEGLVGRAGRVLGRRWGPALGWTACIPSLRVMCSFWLSWKVTVQLVGPACGWWIAGKLRSFEAMCL